MRVGVVSDTHGLLRPQVPDLLEGCDAILHAGDVGDPEILKRLADLAPVTAVRGNVDTTGRLAALPDQASGTLAAAAGLPALEAVDYRMVHRFEDAPQSWFDGAGVVIYGHSHRPEITWRGSCLILNPGACGPRRFRLPLTLALLHVSSDGRLTPELLPIEP